MNTFDVGNRVICVGPAGNKSILGEIGTIKRVESNGFLCVDFDLEFENGHDCQGACRNRHGWYLMNSCLKLYEEEKNFDEFNISFLEVLGL